MSLKIRKWICGGAAALLVGLPMAAAVAQAAGKSLVYVGGSGKGFSVCSFDAATGKLEKLSAVGGEVERPTALAVDPRHRFLYVTSELGNDGKAEGEIYSFKIDAQSGALTLRNKVQAGGGGTTFLTVDATGRTLIANNYGGGQVAVFALKADGSIGERKALISQSAGGRAAHPHHTVMTGDNRRVLVADKGMDRVYSYQFDANSGTLSAAAQAFVQLPEGYGPRHLALAPNERFVYAIDESEGAVTQLGFDKKSGALKPLETVSLLPAGSSAEKNAAEIWVEPKGRFLYASNRGDDVLLVFAIDAAKGTLSLQQRISSGGKTPRSFTADPTGRFLLVANQQSNRVDVFAIDATSGKLMPAGQPAEATLPTAMVFVPRASE